MSDVENELHFDADPARAVPVAAAPTEAAPRRTAARANVRLVPGSSGTGNAPMPSAPGELDKLTETGAAERFARLHGDEVRYDHRRRRFLLWRPPSWTPDADGAITRLAVQFSRTWQRESMDITGRDLREATFRYALRLERRDVMQSMLRQAADLRPIADVGDSWDSDPWLLCTPSGVVELRTGELRPGRQCDRLTMRTAVAYDPAATCPRWERFVAEVFEDPALIGFVQRAVGYSLTGETREQCLFLGYGVGANGKTTFLNAIGQVLGDYAHVMPFSTIELRDKAAIPNDVAALVGRRFVTRPRRRTARGSTSRG